MYAGIANKKCFGGIKTIRSAVHDSNALSKYTGEVLTFKSDGYRWSVNEPRGRGETGAFMEPLGHRRMERRLE